ncbi:MAG: type II toxin-antitoxin system RelE/ParE family toxin [Acidobacteriota bacterium]
MAYKIQFAKQVKSHLDGLTATQRSTVLDAIERQLTNEPSTETRNRKPLRPNPIAPWELRVGELRVFYEVSVDAPAVVHVLAVGIKTRSTLRIGGEEIKL